MPSASSPVASGSSIGVGIIGLSASGGWAAASHLPALRALDGFDIRALSTSNPGSARRAGEQYGVPLAFGSAKELAESPDVDLVVVSVKAPDHYANVMAALNAGKMVLSEWPLGKNAAETRELAETAEAKGVRTFVGLQARTAPHVQYLRDLIADGYVGDVLSTTLVGSGHAYGDTVDQSNIYLLDPANGATLLTIPFGHTIDALTMVLGEFADLDARAVNRRTTVRVAQTGEEVAMRTADQIAVQGVLESGAVVSAHYRGGLSRGTNFLWEINGTEGDIQITGPNGHLQVGPITLHGARGESGEMAELPLPAAYELPALANARTSPAYTVGHAYAGIREDLSQGTHRIADFTHAHRRQQLFDRIEAAAKRD
ncbi:Gfo/Idh/MocA family oxidoreductase [Streptomyces phaeochromogenes]|uniref:Gfo/Idh/MocA family protein n=1 Tax=Streptomyces phaeochromogenes TaxID=1923 RepID=UPI003865FE01|nr:Gfo/Idh/MocA family oxidoreductase [Streptomyces phaeochromogenes]